MVHAETKKGINCQRGNKEALASFDTIYTRKNYGATVDVTHFTIAAHFVTK